MELVWCSWLLPDAAWQVVCHHLHREDLLAARIVCSAWRRDLGAFISTATIIPSQLLKLRNHDSATAHTSSSDSSSERSADAHVCQQGAAGQEEQAAEAAAVGRHKQEALANAGDCAGQVIRTRPAAAGASVDFLEPELEADATAVMAVTQVQQSWSVKHDFGGQVQWLLGAFPHCELIHVDASSPAEQQFVTAVVNAIARQSSSTAGPAFYAPGALMEECLPTDDGADNKNSPELDQILQSTSGRSNNSCVAPVDMFNRPQLCLDILQRCYHCQARQEYPSKSGAGRDVFQFLTQLPAQLSPAGLHALSSLQLDVFPDSPTQWAALQHLPWLRDLVLPFFKPAVPHEHLPGLAKLTHLEALTLSVQGSITSWRTTCAAFAALCQLRNLQRLHLHAFHCPGTHLASALLCMTGLSELRLSGRVVLEPLSGLSALTKLQVLELTQDVQYSFLCGVARQLPGVTQLAVGRVTMPPEHLAAAAELEGPAAVWNPAQHAAAAGMAWQPAPLAAAAAGLVPVGANHAPAAAGDGVGNELPGAAAANPAAGGGGDVLAAAAVDEAPANANAAAVVVAADGGGGAVAAAAGGEGGVGEVMLEDVGAIVDGLIGNLQDGAVPVHLQRIIERFESIIQLDLTRRAATSPWGWPVAGLALLSELGIVQQQQQPQPDTGNLHVGSARSTSSSADQVSSSSSSRRCVGGAAGCASFEFALLRPADVVRLAELPYQLLGCIHLGLRLRDQLLAFASVCPVRLAPGKLSCLGAAFRNLASLNLCGKIAMDGNVLVELCQGLSHTQAPAAAAVPTAAAHKTTVMKSDGVAGKLQALRCHAAAASRSSSSAVATCCHDDRAAAAAGGGESDDTVCRNAGQAPAGLACLCLDCHFVGVTAQHIAAALQHLPALKVLSLRHRGGGKLPVPLSALPKSLHTLAAKKVLLYHERGSSMLCNATQHARPHLHQRCEVEVPAAPSQVDCHVITSPNFGRANISRVGLRGVLSTEPSATAADMPGLAGLAPDELSPRTSSSSSDNADHITMADTQTAVDTNNQRSVQEHLGALVGGPAAQSCTCSSAALPYLTGLFLKNCIVGNEILQLLLGLCPAALACPNAALGGSSSSSPGCAASHGVGQASTGQLVRLSVTGDNAAHGEMCESWPSWVAAIKRLTKLQVLDLTVPDSLGSSLPPKLLEAVANLPRLAHLHLTTSSTPSQLLGLTQLSGLRTLSLNYTGPPVLPQELLGQLHAGLGPRCKVQLWEMVVMQHADSFGNELGAAGNVAGGAGDGGASRHSRREKVKGALLWGAMHAVSIWIGWRAGSRIRRYRMERKAHKKQQLQ